MCLHLLLFGSIEIYDHVNPLYLYTISRIPENVTYNKATAARETLEHIIAILAKALYEKREINIIISYDKSYGYIYVYNKAQNVLINFKYIL